MTSPSEQTEAAQDKHEVERRFTVIPDRIPGDLAITAELLIDQGYVAKGVRGSEQRTRRILNTATGQTSHTITIKTSEGLVRGEPINEAPIPEDLFDALWNIVGDNSLYKLRHIMPEGPHELSLDRFLGRHRGLIIAEVEFDGESVEEKSAAAQDFVPKDWFDYEVTGDKRFGNYALATSRPTFNPMADQALRVIQLIDGTKL